MNNQQDMFAFKKVVVCRRRAFGSSSFLLGSGEECDDDVMPVSVVYAFYFLTRNRATENTGNKANMTRE